MEGEALVTVALAVGVTAALKEMLIDLLAVELGVSEGVADPTIRLQIHLRALEHPVSIVSSAFQYKAVECKK